MEVWKDHPNYIGYQASTFGRVRSLRRKSPKVLKTRLYGDYLTVTIIIDGRHQMRSVHRIVAETFIANLGNKSQVNHINGDKTDNRVENLEWATRLENSVHAVKLNLTASGERNGQAKLSDEQAAYIRAVYKPFDRVFGKTALAHKFGVCPKTIYNVLHGESFKQSQGPLRPKQSIRIPSEIRDAIRKLYRKGVPGHGLPSLAKKFGLSVKSIHNIVREI